MARPSATFSQVRIKDAVDVTYGTPSARQSLMYDSGTGKFVVRSLVVADIAALATTSPGSVAVAGVRDARTSNDEGYLIATDSTGRMAATFLPTIALTTTGNLNGLSNNATARTNLGLGTAAVLNTGTTSGTLPILGGSGKLDIATIPDALIGAANYQGAWNASTNSPTIPAAASGNKGHYYVVSTAGSTNINGITDWKIGDWIISNGAAWQKIDNTDQVVSVNDQQGIVVLTGNDINTSVPWGADATLTEAVEWLNDNKASIDYVDSGLSGKADVSHTHVVGDLSNADYRGEGTESLLAATTALASPLTVVWFGSGADGSLTVSSGTTNVTTSKQYADITVSGGTLVLGTDNAIWGRKTIRVSGTLTLSGAGVIRGALYNQVGPTAGARKTTAGAGNAATSGHYTTSTLFGGPGGGAAGGGDGTNIGGAGRTDGYRNNAYFNFPGINYTNESATPAGATGAGANGSSPSQPYSLPSSAVAMAAFAGALGGFAGGGGACKVAGGSNYGGAGGAAGRGSCGLELYVNHLVITTGSGCLISAAGEAGSAGETGNAVNTSGDICGGGGGGGGGAGGFIVLICRKLTVNGTRRNQAWVDAGNLSSVLTVAGGAGGAGGGGRKHDGTPNVAYAAGNGGNGGTGTNGAMYIVVTN